VHADARLNPDQFDVWYRWTQECLDAGLEAYGLSLLTQDEIARVQGFKFEYLRHECLVTRAPCRSTLSRYAKVHPADWRFSDDAHGRPEVSRPHMAERLRFNLSDARSLVACGVASSADVGIDVEETDRFGEMLSNVDRFFSRFEQWTLKEPCIKTRGMGLRSRSKSFRTTSANASVSDSIRPLTTVPIIGISNSARLVGAT